MFKDRVDAAQKLCQKLLTFKNDKSFIVVGLTRGGIVTAKIISSFLKIPLHAVVVKKIGAPYSSELAIGALVTLKDAFWNEALCQSLNITKDQKNKLAEQKVKEVETLQKELKIKKNEKIFKGKNVILVDDGVATGASVMAAYNYLLRSNAKKIILATPMIAYDTLRDISKYFDRIIFIKQIRDFYSVSQFYKNFPQVTNEEVFKLLNI